MLKNEAPNLLISPHFVGLEVFKIGEVEMGEDDAENIGVTSVGSQLRKVVFLLYFVFLVLLSDKLVQLQTDILLLRKLDNFFNNTTLILQKLIRLQKYLLFFIFNRYERQFMFITIIGCVVLLRSQLFYRIFGWRLLHFLSFLVFLF